MILQAVLTPRSHHVMCTHISQLFRLIFSEKISGNILLSNYAFLFSVSAIFFVLRILST
jgi:hypothetical protein